MTWAEEVAAATAVVRAEFDDTEQALIEDVPVIAVESRGPDFLWGAYFSWEREVRIYRPAFDEMPEPELRTSQLTDVIRHELWHALGWDHAEPGHEARA